MKPESGGNILGAAPNWAGAAKLDGACKPIAPSFLAGGLSSQHPPLLPG